MFETKKRILIAEDHILLRSGLKALLNQEPDMEVVGEAENGREAARLVGSLEPDLVLTDLTMPGMNGIEAVREIKQRRPSTRVLVMTVHNTHDYIQESFKAGADGYILKDATHAELLGALRTVLRGRKFLSEQLSGDVIERYVVGNGSPAPEAASPWDRLTDREKEVLKLVAEGHPNRQIAAFHSLSVKTVEKHRSNLMKKLGLRNAASLTAYAIAKGLLVTEKLPDRSEPRLSGPH